MATATEKVNYDSNLFITQTHGCVITL